MSSDELVAFLSARFDEDERAARFGDGIWWAPPDLPGKVYDSGGGAAMDLVLPERATFAVRWSPARVLREIEAKRRIVDMYATTVRIRDEAAERIKAAGDSPPPRDLDTWNRAQREASVLYEPTFLLALPYADHPDYREAWRP